MSLQSSGRSAPSPAAAVPSAATEPALLVDKLRHVYGRLVALDGLSFALAKGEILALVGHSGSGKSTLLRLAAGLERPTSGRILIAGREVSGPEHFVPPERRGVGLMFQDYALFPHMTVAENVMFGLAALPVAERRKIAKNLLERVGLATFEDTFPHLISGGEQQRVALARALAPRPHVMLMDEPFSNLDRNTRDLVRDGTVELLRQSGASAIFVTHDPEDAVRVADRIVMLRAGHVIQTGTPDELFRRPASLFVARFFSEFNEIEGTARDGRIETALGSFPAAGLADGAHAVVCIRPNQLAIRDDENGRCAGIIAGERLLGDSVLSTVAIEGLTRTLQAKGPSRHAPGSHVSIDFSPADALIFPMAEEPASGASQ